MRYNKLGSTGLFVSELCLGTMTFGASGQYEFMGKVEQADADAQIARALEAGINFIDTADTYSDGNSERVTGQALKNLGTPRDQVVVATKVFGSTGPAPNQQGSSRGHILDAANASLARLQLDHIDLYQLHGFDPATPIEETLGALNDLVTRGWCAISGYLIGPPGRSARRWAFLRGTAGRSSPRFRRTTPWRDEMRSARLFPCWAAKGSACWFGVRLPGAC